jgi:hypothetical protein
VTPAPATLSTWVIDLPGIRGGGVRLCVSRLVMLMATIFEGSVGWRRGCPESWVRYIRGACDGVDSRPSRSIAPHGVSGLTSRPRAPSSALARSTRCSSTGGHTSPRASVRGCGFDPGPGRYERERHRAPAPPWPSERTAGPNQRPSLVRSRSAADRRSGARVWPTRRRETRHGTRRTLVGLHYRVAWKQRSARPRPDLRKQAIAAVHAGLRRCLIHPALGNPA